MKTLIINKSDEEEVSFPISRHWKGKTYRAQSTGVEFVANSFYTIKHMQAPKYSKLTVQHNNITVLKINTI